MNTLLEAAGGMSAILGSPIFMFVLIIAIMYFMMIRPQRKRQKEIDNFRRGLRAGQDIITSGGIYGKIKTHINEFFYEPFPQAITINKFFLKKDKKRKTITRFPF